MQTNITGHDLEITPAMRQYIAEKLERIERHFSNIIGARVVLNVVKDTHYAEGTLSVPGKKLVAEAADENMYTAIDTLCDRLDRQVRRYKSKLKDHHQGENLRGRAAGGAG